MVDNSILRFRGVNLLPLMRAVLRSSGPERSGQGAASQSSSRGKRKMRRLSLRVAALVMAALLVASVLAGCAKAPATSSQGPAPAGEKRIKIGVSVATMQESVYSFMKKAIEDQAAKDGVDIVWVSADNKEDKQLADVENLLSQGINGLILHSVNTGAAANLVAKAKAKNVPVVAMDRLPENTNDVALYVTADSKKVGEEQAKYLVSKLGGKGKVIILEGEAGNGVARDITAGNKEILGQNAGIQIVADQAHKSWARDLAMATVENVLTKENNDIQGVLANNSGMAMGAVQALKKRGLAGKVVVIGSDADLDACQSIVAGELTADVDKKPVELGLASYRAALALARGQSVNADTTIGSIKVQLTPIQLIDKTNVDTMTYRWPELKK